MKFQKNGKILIGNNFKQPFLSVVMPAYNEEITLSEIIKKVLEIPHLLELIVVDDCSMRISS